MTRRNSSRSMVGASAWVISTVRVVRPVMSGLRSEDAHDVGDDLLGPLANLFRVQACDWVLDGEELEAREPLHSCHCRSGHAEGVRADAHRRYAGPLEVDAVGDGGSTA